MNEKLKTVDEKLTIKKAARTVIFDDNKLTPIIIVRGGEYYKIPGGGIEEGETDEEAAKREALEEAGCEVELVKKIGEQEFVDPGPKHHMIHHSVCYLAKKIDKTKDPEFDEWEKNNNFNMRWVDYDEAVQLFQSSKTDDKFGEEINKRDLEFLIKCKDAFKLD